MASGEKLGGRLWPEVKVQVVRKATKTPETKIIDLISGGLTLMGLTFLESKVFPGGIAEQMKAS